MKWIPVLFLSLLWIFVQPAFASENEKLREMEQKIEALQKQLDALQQRAVSPELEEIKRQVTILAQELETLRSGEQVVELEASRQKSLGVGPSAATVYTKKQGVSIAGYGEMLFEDFSEDTDSGDASSRTNQIDFLRAIVYFGYRFNNNFLFNSEIEFEHASTGESGEASVEFAYLDYIHSDALSLRGGLVLVPMGFVNEFHEPTVFLGARRPLTETVILPTTWRENGFGVVGQRGIVDYRAYLMNGFDAAGFRSSGLRGGRQKGSRARLNGPAFVGRLDLTPAPGFLVGGSFYGANSGVFGVPDVDFDVPTIIVEGHAEYRARGWEIRGLFAKAFLDNIAELNDALGLTGSSSAGDELSGGYIQTGYNILAGGNQKFYGLTPYVRYESVNTQSKVPAGFMANPTNDQSIWTFGVELRPIFNVVLKVDYQNIGNDAGSGVNQWNILLGYAF